MSATAAALVARLQIMSAALVMNNKSIKACSSPAHAAQLNLLQSSRVSSDPPQLKQPTPEYFRQILCLNMVEVG